MFEYSKVSIAFVCSLFEVKGPLLLAAGRLDPSSASAPTPPKRYFLRRTDAALRRSTKYVHGRGIYVCVCDTGCHIMLDTVGVEWY